MNKQAKTKSNYISLFLLTGFFAAFFPVTIFAQALESESFIIESDSLSGAAGTVESLNYSESGFLGGTATGTGDFASFFAELGSLYGDSFYSIALNCDPIQNLDTIIGYGYSDLSDQTPLSCQTITKNPAGYELSFQIANTRPNNKFALTTNSNVGLDPLPSNTFDSSNQALAHYAVSADPNANYSDSSWTGLSQTSSQTLVHNDQATPDTGNTDQFIFGAWVGDQSGLTSGDYQTDLIITATTL